MPLIEMYDESGEMAAWLKAYRDSMQTTAQDPATRPDDRAALARDVEYADAILTGMSAGWIDVGPDNGPFLRGVLAEDGGLLVWASGERRWADVQVIAETLQTLDEMAEDQ